MRLHRFHGGLSLPGHKAESTAGRIRPCPLPPELIVSLLQHAGPPAEACVAVGDTVRCGQRIGRAVDGGADVHAPAAGEVLAVEMREPPHLPGLPVPHLRLRTGHARGDLLRLPSLDWRHADTGALRERLRAAGVVGLGGAGFPTAEKLSVARERLVLNGAECEPWIACDDALLREQAEQVVLGGRAMARIAGCARIQLAVEDSMPEAIRACREAVAKHGAGQVELVVVPTRYPEGGERQLIQVLTGLEVPRGGLPRDIGVLVHNVGTARAAWRAIEHGEPLLSRVVTVTGPGVAKPGNFDVPLGTPVAHLVAQAGGYTPRAARLLLGGPMMGTALPDDQAPIGKTHNCVLVMDAVDLRPAGDAMPCIRCGDCAVACPSRLLPQQLHWQLRAGADEAAVADGLFDCIECGCCDLACPSHIPLTQQFRLGKARRREATAAAEAAEAAGERHRARDARLRREAQAREQRQAARKAQLASPDAVAAAVERARARKAGDGGDGA